VHTVLISAATIILLAILQGLTEFLPVSSSGHLVLAQHLIGARAAGGTGQGVGFEVAVHVGTLGAILLVYRRRISKLCLAAVSFLASGLRRTDDNSEDVRYVGLLIVASLPAAFVGLAFRDSLVMLFDAPSVTALFLVATGFYLLLSRIRSGSAAISGRVALMIGIAQAVAILPGCSRSGWTITTGLLLGLGGREAAEFSFLLAIPAILGALALEVIRGSFSASHSELLLLVIGAATAFGSGYVALRLLLKVMAVGRLYRFAYYLIPAGILAFVYFISTR
jgi:undecaprenyl-diphosphatase